MAKKKNNVSNNELKDQPSQGKNFSIDVLAIDEVASYLSEQLNSDSDIRFNPFTREYTFSDGTSIRSGFFTETMIVMTNYMNVVNRTMNSASAGIHPIVQSITSDSDNPDNDD